ncbi:uroporphyrinogen-III synthase [Rhodobacter maris]|uniref:Uroporphyrinogen-III synthase n=1 Tax=Rhodobacter maris TaxID=446682 RepID=A0A285SGS1_9RHOB|nr:uroporphyrinogen-III synthase [Rhodobacter maris]SOC06799.1 uroporphyrinogen-III synthase [Rhodobacter maris]
MREDEPFRPPLLLTRPRVGSERFARQFRARMDDEHWPVTIAPLLEIEPTGADLPAANALIITSESAVAPVAAAPALAGKPVYCVGERTAQALTRAGFEVALVAPDAKTLLPMILAVPDPGALLHARGSDIAFPLAERLTESGREVREAVVYAQMSQPPAPELLALLATPGPVLVPVFSPNSGRLLTEAAEGAQATLRVAAISHAAAEACATLPCSALRVAAKPSAEALLDVLVALMRNSSG